MQVKFNTEMRGRMGAGQANDTRQERWSEFFGDIEFLRSKVANDGVILNPDDRLSEDGFYLTSQILRIIQEPPPAGSPEKTPARSFAKAWDRVHVNKGETMAIEADVTTYDSGTDLLWAYGEGERGVTFASRPRPASRSRRTTARPCNTTSSRTPADSSGATRSASSTTRPAAARQRRHARPDRSAQEEGQEAVLRPEHQPRAPRLHGLLTLAGVIA